MPIDQYYDLFVKYGFLCASAINIFPTPTSSMTSDYWNPEGPLSAEWRSATNFFEVPGHEIVKEMMSIVNAMKERGTLKQFMIDHDHTLKKGIIHSFRLYFCIVVV